MEISLSNIRENYHAIRSLAKGREVIACIKGDAYGHGILKLAWEYVREGAEYLGVATIEEATALRSSGIRTPIVLMSPVPRRNAKDVVDLGLIPIITTLEDAVLVSNTAVNIGAKKDIPFFIAVETGMGRLGFMYTPEAMSEIFQILSMPGIRMIGLYSHFATADETDLSHARAQLGRFIDFETHLREAGVSVGKRTIANSAAIMALPESLFDIVRPGIALYGLYPSKTMDRGALPLKPVMSVKADIVYLKTVPPGFAVSYGSHFVTERESIIATLPIGYGDGLPRATSGKGRILVRGQFAPLVGTICMDMCMADVTDITGVSEYDEVVLMGEQGGKTIPAEEIAENSDTIVYETICRFGQRLPRKYT